MVSPLPNVRGAIMPKLHAMRQRMRNPGSGVHPGDLLISLHVECDGVGNSGAAHQPTVTAKLTTASSTLTASACVCIPNKRVRAKIHLNRVARGDVIAYKRAKKAGRDDAPDVLVVTVTNTDPTLDLTPSDPMAIPVDLVNDDPCAPTTP
jgi:hypothetical protein